MSPLCFTLKDYLGAYGAYAPGFMLSPASQAQSECFKRAHRENTKLLSFQSIEEFGDEVSAHLDLDGLKFGGRPPMQPPLS